MSETNTVSRRRRAAVFLPTAVMLASLGVLALPVHADVITVGGSGAAAPTISVAVSMASDGDVIQIHDGEYFEIINTSKALTFETEGAAGSVVMDGSSFATVLSFTNVNGAVHLSGIVFRNGHGTRGGAVNADNVSLGITIEDCRFEGSDASVGGGALDLSSANFEIDGCEFQSCAAAGMNAHGGAISIRNGSTGNISNSLFQDNLAAGYGGAVQFTGSVDFFGCTFRSNGALRGGAIYGSSTSNADFEQCVFELNDGSDYGGGLFLTGAGGELKSSVFRGCTSTYGGGVYVAAGSAFAVHSTQFTDCSAQKGGGLGGASMLAEVRQCTFYSDAASDAGAALWCNGSAPAVSQNIFAEASAGEALLCGSGTPTLSCNLFWNNSDGNVNGCSDPVGDDGNVESDPLFCDAAGDNLNIEDISPAAAENVPGECPEERIGAYGILCGASSTREMSWGRLKSAYR